MTVHSSVLDLIGNTPMVDVSALSSHPGARILVKLEGQNPTGSVKDRIAKAMVEEAEADGTLVPGRTIIEPSSGNTGIALAMRSFTEPAGFWPSSLTRIRAPGWELSVLTSTIGVSPMRSSTEE